MIRKLRINEDSWDDFVAPNIEKRYIWPLYEDSKYEITDIIEKYQNMNRFKNEIRSFDFKDIDYMGYPALQLELVCSNEAYTYIRYDLEKEGLYMDLDEEDFNEGCHGKKSRKRRKGLKKESAYTLDSCPDCGGHISDDGNGYVCDDCGETYPYEGNPGSNNDYNDDNAYCIYYVNELDSEFGYDPGPEVVEDNLERSYAYKRAEELNATAQDFEKYFVEPEPKRY